MFTKHLLKSCNNYQCQYHDQAIGWEIILMNNSRKSERLSASWLDQRLCVLIVPSTVNVTALYLPIFPLLTQYNIIPLKYTDTTTSTNDPHTHPPSSPMTLAQTAWILNMLRRRHTNTTGISHVKCLLTILDELAQMLQAVLMSRTETHNTTGIIGLTAIW